MIVNIYKSSDTMPLKVVILEDFCLRSSWFFTDLHHRQWTTHAQKKPLYHLGVLWFWSCIGFPGGISWGLSGGFEDASSAKIFRDLTWGSDLVYYDIK